MAKISINLLPQTVLLERIQSSKTNFVYKVSISILVLVIIITVGVIFLRVVQNNENNKVNSAVKLSEDKVFSFKDQEQTVFALKNRLDMISTLVGNDAKVKTIFSLIIYLTPPEVGLYDAAVDKNGTMTATFTSTSLNAVDTLLSNLSNKEKNLNLISKVNLDGISLGRDATYRFSLKIFSL